MFVLFSALLITYFRKSKQSNANQVLLITLLDMMMCKYLSLLNFTLVSSGVIHEHRQTYRIGKATSITINIMR